MIIAAFDVGETTGICIVDTVQGRITDHYCVSAENLLRTARVHAVSIETVLIEQFPNVMLPEPILDAYLGIQKIFYYQGYVLVKPSTWKPAIKRLKIKLPCKNAQHDFDAYGMIVHFMFSNKMLNYGDLKCEMHPR